MSDGIHVYDGADTVPSVRPLALLNIRHLTREFLMLLSSHFPEERGYAKGPIEEELYVDFVCAPENLEMSLDEFSELFIVPCAIAMARRIGKSRISADAFEIRHGDADYTATSEIFRGMAVRGIMHRQEHVWLTEWNQFCDPQQWVIRFDLRTVNVCGNN